MQKDRADNFAPHTQRLSPSKPVERRPEGKSILQGLRDNLLIKKSLYQLKEGDVLPNYITVNLK